MAEALQTALSNCINVAGGNVGDDWSSLTVHRLSGSKRPIRVGLLCASSNTTLAFTPDQARDLAAALILQADAFDALNAVLQVVA